MKIGLEVSWAGVVVAFCLGCSPAVRPEPAIPAARPVATATDDALVQFSLVTTLATGDYAGGAPLEKLLSAGDFGIGTFSRLDGEMILLDGKIHQALGDGTVRPADLKGGTPFAAVTFFDEDGHMANFAAATLDDLDQQLDRKLPRPNAPYAIRVDGKFEQMTLRSVPAQNPPFQPLVEVVKQQVTWQHRDLRGTLIGLRCPSWMGSLNVAGYHWHFLSDDQSVGGHVLACQIQDGLLRYDECTSIVVHLPRSDTFDAFDAGQVKASDIDKIERQRGPTDEP